MVELIVRSVKRNADVPCSIIVAEVNCGGWHTTGLNRVVVKDHWVSDFKKELTRVGLKVIKQRQVEAIK